MKFNGTCNTTLEDMMIRSGSEEHLAGNLTFHQLGLIVAAGCTLISILLSVYLMWMHALHYTKPYEQRHIIRILFMVPVYSTASFLAFWFYWHSIYFYVISECYEAFAIASFFALLCHYIAPTLHEQKQYFRSLQPIGWVWPITWAWKCCGGNRGPWRTPRSGLTWFNIIWTGVYQYCFIRITMTITAVVTQYFGKYCESSNSPLFGHIWILVIEGAAVSVAMFCLIQFYIQLRHDLAPHRPFLKVVAIKLVIFLSFWQSFLISILTSATFNVVKPTTTIAYPDLKVGIPSLLLCIEMAIFAVLHLFAFPYTPYRQGTNPDGPSIGKNQGGLLGWRAIADAMNPWDLVKAFARGMRWLMVGRKHRENDPSYARQENDMALQAAGTAYKGDDHLPIANEFRRSKFGIGGAELNQVSEGEEGAGLIAHAQPNPLNPGSGYVPASQRYDSVGQDISQGGDRYEGKPYADSSSPDRLAGRNPTPGSLKRQEGDTGVAAGYGESDSYGRHAPQQSYPQQQQQPDVYLEERRQQRRQQPNPSEQWANSSQPTAHAQEVHNALWGGRPPPQPRNDENQF